MPLEAGDLMAERGLRDVATLGRGGEASGLRDSDHILELPLVHHGAIVAAGHAAPSTHIIAKGDRCDDIFLLVKGGSAARYWTGDDGD
ncbi:MAG TPA: hypothetical protein VHW06_07660 [Streptosporangiaceae bacterium]|jgi:hypothetical protein|nr:hypothetical protein [Streptosporangiaceae bacterium]